MASGHFDVFAPLQSFQWDGSSFAFAPGVSIRAYETVPELRGLDKCLGEDEQNRVSSTRFWLLFEWSPGDQLSAAEILNLALLSFWLVKPTKTHVTHRFHLGQGSQIAEKRMYRLLDRFSWVQGIAQDQFTVDELRLAAKHYGALHAISLHRGRLNDALILTLTGCWSHRWQAAFISHAAAVEALLTYSKKPGLTKRLSTSYACLVETQAAARDTAYREFSSLYSTRSDIMHGRAGNIATLDRLPLLVRFQDVTRNIWRVVAQSQALAIVLEEPDAQRETHFLAIESGYSPPP